MRQFSTYATGNTKPLLDRLVHDVQPAEYRQAMIELGAELGRAVATRLSKENRILLVCTNEDADFLAKGLLQAVQDLGFAHVGIACFWNDRVRRPAEGIDIAPIVRSYIEPTQAVDAFVVVKSIISSACVVRTLVTELVYRLQPKRILVASPVVLSGSQERLTSEFGPDVAGRFEYLWFAQDSESKPDGEVVPGIGGSVYERLGIGTSASKNSYTPELIRQRRQRFHAAVQ